MSGWKSKLSVIERVHADVTSRASSKDLLELVCGEFGVAHASYVSLTSPQQTNGQPFVSHTYRQDWETRYWEANHLSVDPVIEVGALSLLPMNWAEMQSLRPQSRTFFAEAAELDVGTMGITIPIRGPNGERAMFSISTVEQNRSWELFVLEELPSLNLIAYHVHEMLLRSDELASAVPHLSPREREVLIWAANGKTYEETSIILGIRPSTVTHYIQTARFKLHASNTTQAVARAIKFGLIPQPE